MTMSYIDLADVGTTREVLAGEPPRGVRNLILIAAVVLIGLSIAMGFLRVQQAQTLGGVIVAEGSVRTQIAQVAGVVAEVHVLDGQAVSAGQVVMNLDARSVEARLAVVKAEQDASAVDLENYARLRDAVIAGDNPFNSVTEAAFYYALEQYRQQLAQADDTRRQEEQSQESAQKTAQAVLSQSEVSLSDVTRRSTELSRLVSAIRSGSTYSSSDAYCQALFQSYQQGRPADGAVPGQIVTQSTADYDASFILQVESHIADLGVQQSSYETEIVRLRAQMSTPNLDPNADAAAYVTAQFMLSITAKEQELRQNQTSLALESMSLNLSVEQSVLTAPVAGTVEMSFDWQVGDPVQAGQHIFTVAPDAGRTLLEVAIPAQLAPHLQDGRVLPCSLPITVGTAKIDVECRVERLSAAYQTDDNGQIYYFARLAVEAINLDEQTALSNTTLPGVPMTVTLPIREVTVMRWVGEKIGFLKSE